MAVANLIDPGRGVLVVSTEWGSRHGGLSTLNRGLCSALVEAGQRVVCLVLELDDHEQQEAAAAGVDVVVAATEPGASPDARLRKRPHLPGFVPTAVIGHGRVTGPAARSLRDDHYPEAKLLQVVHTAPADIEWFKVGSDLRAVVAADRDAQERWLVEGADVVGAVGPQLARQARDHAQGAAVVEILPSLGVIAPERHAVPARRRVLIQARAEDFELKGLDIAARAVGRLQTVAVSKRPKLVVRGAPVDDDTLHSRLSLLIGSEQAVEVRPFTTDRDRLDADLREASVVVMPSRTEGFGLVGLEAIDAGVPVLLSSRSGLSEVLGSVDGRGDDESAIVSVDGPDDAVIDLWAKRIDFCLENGDTSSEAASVRWERLSEVLSWQSSAHRILTELKLPDPTRLIDRPTTRPSGGAPFVGREKELADIREIVDGTNLVAVTGLGGVGKSRVARELGTRFEQSGRAVRWVSGATRETLIADLESLVGDLEVESTVEMLVQLVADTTPAGTVLIVDNVDRPADVDSILAGWGGRPLVVTSQHGGGWSSLGAEYPLGPWSRSDSKRFIESRIGGDQIAAAELAEALGDFPLALEQSVAYIDETRIDAVSYLSRLRERAPDMFDASKPRDYQFTVASVWDLAHDRLAKQPGAMNALHRCAFLAHEDIPRELLADDEPGADQAVRFLSAYSQVSPRGATAIDVHRLVAGAVRRRLADDHKETAAALDAAIALAKTWPIDTPFHPDRWAEAERLTPHALACATHLARLCEADGPDGEASTASNVGPLHVLRSDLVRNAAELMRARGKPQASADLLDTVRNEMPWLDQRRRTLFGREIGIVKIEARRLTEGLEALEVAVRDSEGGEARLRARTRDALGIARYESGDYEGAVREQQAALSILPEGESGDRAAVLGNLARSLRRVGRVDEAVSLARDSLELHESIYGASHREVAVALSGLARVLYERGERTEPIALEKRAAAVLTAVLGGEHPETISQHQVLGGLLLEAGDATGAVAQLEAALAGAVVDGEYSLISEVSSALAAALRTSDAETSSLDGAARTVEIMSDLLDLTENAFGAESPLATAVLHTRGDAWHALSELERAAADWYGAAAGLSRESDPMSDTPEVIRFRLSVVHPLFELLRADPELLSASARSQVEELWEQDLVALAIALHRQGLTESDA